LGGSRVIKRLAITILILLASFCPSFARGDGNIRVLILDKGFDRVPRKEESLKKLDDVDGRLVLGYSSYVGKLSIWKGDGGLYLVNTLPLEDYVKGVVLAETGRQWAREALKAQAVIVRTYVLSRASSARRPEYHVTSSVLHQVYKGLNSDVNVDEAVNSTMDEILTYKGKPIVAFYHSTSVGSTEFPENVFGKSYPYMPSVKASGRLSPYAFWNRRVPLVEIEGATNLRGLKDIRVGSRTGTGRVDEVVLVTSEGENILKAKDLRRLLGWRKLPSTDFDVYVTGSEAVLDGKGYGHGVGLCQWTALEMALEDRNYKEILAHFYPGAEITLHEGI
jgi:stage II sporulation protein D